MLRSPASSAVPACLPRLRRRSDECSGITGLLHPLRRGPTPVPFPPERALPTPTKATCRPPPKGLSRHGLEGPPRPVAGGREHSARGTWWTGVTGPHRVGPLSPASPPATAPPGSDGAGADDDDAVDDLTIIIIIIFTLLLVVVFFVLEKEEEGRNFVPLKVVRPIVVVVLLVVIIDVVVIVVCPALIVLSVMKVFVCKDSKFFQLFI